MSLQYLVKDSLYFCDKKNYFSDNDDQQSCLKIIGKEFPDLL